MTEQTMIERVGRAIESVDLFCRFNDWTSNHVPGLPIEICQNEGAYDVVVIARYAGRTERDGEQYLRRHIREARARAAIEAMREPIDEMVMAGIAERHEQPCPEAWKLAMKNIWAAMIDAALA